MIMKLDECDDPIACRELLVCIENTYFLKPCLDRLTGPIWNNLARKKAKGIYDRDLAIQGIANNLIPDAIKRYSKEYGVMRLSKMDRWYCAQQCLKLLNEEYGLKNVKIGSKPRMR